MESTSANEPNFDPAADLALISAAKSSVARDQLLDFGPAWYAPALATCLGAATLFGRGSGMLTNTAFGVLAFGAAILLTAHDYGRRRVCARPSVRTALAVVPIVLLTFGLLAAWGTAVSTIGYDDFVPIWAFVSWAATTALLLVVRSLLHARRRQTGELG